MYNGLPVSPCTYILPKSKFCIGPVPECVEWYISKINVNVILSLIESVKTKILPWRKNITCIYFCIWNIIGIDVELQWFQKAPTRMPESIYFMFRPISNPKLSWKLHKVGQFIDPLNVILNGSQILHGENN